MTKASDNAFPSILITEGTEPSAPAAGKQRLYIDSTTHKAMLTNSSGTESEIGAAGSMATDALWDAAGDLAQGTGANTAAKLGAGTLGYHLRAGGAATAVAWASRELDYVELTSDISITATTSAGATTVITGTSQAYVAEPIVIEFYGNIYHQADDRLTILVLYDGATELGRLGGWRADSETGTDTRHTAYVARRLTPTAATHQYIVKAFVNSGSLVQVGGAAGTINTMMPAFLRITRAL